VAGRPDDDIRASCLGRPSARCFTGASSGFKGVEFDDPTEPVRFGLISGGRERRTVGRSFPLVDGRFVGQPVALVRDDPPEMRKYPLKLSRRTARCPHSGVCQRPSELQIHRPEEVPGNVSPRRSVSNSSNTRALIRNRAVEHQTRAANQPLHRLREIGLHVSGVVLSRRWWKGITSGFHRHSNQTGTPHNRAPQRRTSDHHIAHVCSRRTRERPDRGGTRNDAEVAAKCRCLTDHPIAVIGPRVGPRQPVPGGWTPINPSGKGWPGLRMPIQGCSRFSGWW
jgi:hypothetical protein